MDATTMERVEVATAPGPEGPPPEPYPAGLAAPPPGSPPAPAGAETPQPPEGPLTSLRFTVVQAFAYAAFVIAFNVALQLFTSSAFVQRSFRSFVFGLAGPAQGQRLAVAAVASALVVSLGYLVIVAPPAIVARMRGIRLLDAFGMRSFEWGRALGLIAALVGGGLVVTIAFGTLLREFGYVPPNNTVRLVQGFGTGTLAMTIGFALVGVIAPIAEEIAFRAVVFGSFERAWGVAAAAAMSGLLFGVVHLQTLEVLPLGLIGAGLALVFARSRSLWVSIAAHGAYNIVVLALAFAAAGLAR